MNFKKIKREGSVFGILSFYLSEIESVTVAWKIDKKKSWSKTS